MRSLLHLLALGAILAASAPCARADLPFTFDPDVRLGQGSPEINEADIQDFFYVDPVLGNNGFDGRSADRPVLTVARALQLASDVNAEGRPVKVILAPGEYFENTPNMAWNSGMINLPGFRSPAPIIIEGAGWEPGLNTGDVVITGSELWEDWTPVSGNGGYEHSWPYGDWGTDPAQPSLAPAVTRRFENVVVDENGDGVFVKYFQMNGPGDPRIGNLRDHEGFFYLDLEDARLVVVPPAGVSLNNPETVTRVTTRKRLMYLFMPGHPVPGHIVIRNLVFEHSGSVALYLQQSVTSTVEDCVFRLNKYAGLIVESFQVNGQTTVRRSLFEDNGVAGIFGDFNDSLLEDLTIVRNARQSFIHEYFGWANCGFKLGRGYNNTFRRWLVDGNYGHGIWLDTNIVDTEVYDCIVRNNAESAFFLEHNNRVSTPGLGSQTTVIVRENLIYDNWAPPESLAGVGPRIGRGIIFSEHENALIKNNLMVNNERAYHFAFNTRGPMARNVLRWNVVAGPAGWPNALFFGPMQAWRDFADTLTNDTRENVYMQADVPLPFINLALEPVDFPAFQAALRENPLNTNPSDRIEEGSVFLAQDYDDRPLVVIRPVISEMPEGAEAVPAFQIKRVGFDFSAALDVRYRLRDLPGDAGPEDFAETFDGTIQIPAGERAVFFTVSPLLDGLVEGTEILHVELLPDAAYWLGQRNAEAFILDADEPGLNRVSVEAVVGSALESAGTVSAFRLNRTGDLSESLTVAVMTSGSANSGEDFAPLPEEFVFPAGEATVEIPVTLIDNDFPQPSRTLTLELVEVGAGPYRLRAPVAADLLILDDDLVSPQLIDISLSGRLSATRIPITVHNPSATEVEYRLIHAETFIVADNRDEHDPAFAWVDIATPENRVAFNWVFPNSDGVSDALPLSFAFPFYGNVFTEAYVHSNGFLTFQRTTLGHGTGWPLPDNNARSPANLIAGFWRNLGIDNQSGVYAAVIDEALFVVQYNNVIANPAFGTPSRTSFQILLQPSGAILVQYAFNNTGNTGTIGLQNADKSRGFVVARNEPFATAGRALRIVPTAEMISLPAETIRIAPNSSMDVELDIDGRFLPAGSYSLELILEPIDPGMQAFRIPANIEILGDLPALSGSFGWTNGSMWSPWFGLFTAYPEAPGWFYRSDAGFVFCVSVDNNSFWKWSPLEEKWIWVHRQAYPLVYDASIEEWVF